ncbi:hypothetical protein L1049_005042 [Liquidambar formosana]|uniref:Pentatricopeptide repeat-containing protein n=1 Tax=Liquidambar formosana TaxID=63359 RepID=A0AAP0X128_LIQFO
MALLTFARRLQRTPSHLLLPPVVRPIAHPPFPTFPTSAFLSKLHTLSKAFHRTVPIPYHTFSQIPHFLALQSFSTQNAYDPIDFSEHTNEIHQLLESGLLELLKRAKQFPSESEAVAFLDEAGLKPDSNLVCSAIWALKDEWRLAFLVFKWGEKRGCDSEKAWSLMVWVLGTKKKFSLAWCLIRELHRSSADTRRLMSIMIDRYAAANDPCKAIRTFNIMEKFRMSPDVKAFYYPSECSM